MTARKIGAKMPDGTIYAGDSPDTGKPMFTTPADAPLTMTFNEAKDYARKLAAQGHEDWRLPTKSELEVLFNNRAAIGAFHQVPYWSGSEDTTRKVVAGQRFTDGLQYFAYEDVRASVRCVR